VGQLEDRVKIRQDAVESQKHQISKVANGRVGKRVHK
jgi:hypothetical protein